MHGDLETMCVCITYYAGKSWMDVSSRMVDEWIDARESRRRRNKRAPAVARASVRIVSR